jgi:hypothetical protein
VKKLNTLVHSGTEYSILSGIINNFMRITLQIGLVSFILLFSTLLVPQSAQAAGTLCTTPFNDTFSGTLNTLYMPYTGQMPTTSNGKLVLNANAVYPVTHLLGPKYSGNYQAEVTISNIGITNGGSVWQHRNGLTLINPTIFSVSISHYLDNTGARKFMMGYADITGRSGQITPIDMPTFPANIKLKLEKVGYSVRGYYDVGGGYVFAGSFEDIMKGDGSYAYDTDINVTPFTVTSSNFANYSAAASFDDLKVGCVSSGFTTKVVHRFWSNRLQTHFYTISESEKSYVQATYASTWTYEGTVFRAVELTGLNCPVGLFKVYRFWSDSLQRHFYTNSAAERDYVQNTYAKTWNNYEGAVYCAANGAIAGSVPVYRFWSDSKSAHFYTVSPTERSFVKANWGATWNHDEGIVYYAFPL